MSRTISILKDSVAAKLSSIDLNNVADLYGSFKTAARVFEQKAKVPETQIKQQLTIYSGVTDYLANTMLYAKSIIDVQPQGITRQSNDFVWLQYQSDFDRMKQYTQFGTKTTLDFTQGVPILRLVSSYTIPKIILDSMNSITGWNAVTGATAPVLDTSFFYQQPGALRFNLTAGHATGSLNKTITLIDLTAYQGVGVAFLAVELPNATSITSITLQVGSSSTNYYTVTNTASTLSNWIAGQFMLVPFDLATATTVGSPTITAITYVNIIFNYDSTLQTNVRVGDLFISLPTPVTVIYGAAAFFSVGGVITNTITDDNTIIVLNDAAYTIYEYECCIAVLESVGGATVDSMIARIDAKLNSSYTRTGKILNPGLYDQYRAENPSETLRTVGQYYNNASPYRGGIYGR